MKRKELTIAAFFLFTVVLSSSHTFREGHGVDGSRKSTGPPACHAGEPPNNVTCRTSGCHSSFPLNSGTALLELDLGGAEDGYIPGAGYTINVSVSKPGLMRGGFQLIALQDDNDTISPGVFTLTNSVRTQQIDINNPHAHPNCPIDAKVWIEHTEDGIDDVSNDAISWQFDWQAPATDVGGITFYVAAVEADLDFDATGDYVYSTSRSVSLSTIGLEEIESVDKIFVYPNPASDILYVGLPATGVVNKNDRLAIYDLTGKVVAESDLSHSISIKALSAGRYVATVEVDGIRSYCPFVKL